SNAMQSDIYVYDLDNKELFNLTSDIFSEYDPKWGPKSRKIYFSSDRGEFINSKNIPEDFEIYYHNYKQLDLYSVDFETYEIERITDWEFSNEKSVVV